MHKLRQTLEFRTITVLCEIKCMIIETKSLIMLTIQTSYIDCIFNMTEKFVNEIFSDMAVVLRFIGITHLPPTQRTNSSSLHIFYNDILSLSLSNRNNSLYDSVNGYMIRYTIHYKINKISYIFLFYVFYTL